MRLPAASHFHTLACIVLSVPALLLGQIAAPPTTTVEAVPLPAFVHRSGANGPDVFAQAWLHTEIPGVEILSGLNAADTATIVRSLQEQSRLLHWELPPELHPRHERPFQLILDGSPLSTLTISRPTATADTKTTGPQPPSVLGLVSVNDWAAASYYLSLERARVLLQSESGRSTRAVAAAVTAASHALLEQMPTPEWLRRGWTNEAGFSRFAGDGFIEFNQTNRSLVDRELPLPSLAVAFAKPDWQPTDKKITTTGALPAARWFIRWALYADQGAHRPAFWNFVKGNTVHPVVNDALVQEHFGMTLADLDARVGSFRHASQATTLLRFMLPIGTVSPAPVIADASEVEVGRMLGQWTLLAWRRDTRLSVPLHEAARRLLLRANKQSGGDPEVTALLGLVELEGGDLERARSLLESVGDSIDIGVRARFELAQTRYAAALKSPAARDQKFDEQQVTGIITLLSSFRIHPPGDPGPLELVAHTWLHAAKAPPKDELETLSRIARRFPQDEQLLQETALLCFQQELDDEASELIAIGLNAGAKEPVRGALQELQKRIDARTEN